MLLELTERLLTIFVAAAQKVIPVLKIITDLQHPQCTQEFCGSSNGGEARILRKVVLSFKRSGNMRKQS